MIYLTLIPFFAVLLFVLAMLLNMVTGRSDLND
jgi:hypothetical protein